MIAVSRLAAGRRSGRTHLRLVRERPWMDAASEFRSPAVRSREPRAHFTGTGAHGSAVSATMSSGVGAGRVAEPMAKFSCEMSVVAKTAGVGDLAQRLARAQQRPALQKARGVIQTKRIDEFTAGRAAPRKELLDVAQRDPRFGRYLARTEIRIGKAVLDDAADTREQLVGMA